MVIIIDTIMNARTNIIIFIFLSLFFSCQDEGGGDNSSNGEAEDDVMPSLSKMGIKKCVKVYDIYTDTYTFQTKADANGNYTFSGMSYKNVYYDATGSIAVKHNPLEIRITFREDIDIMNDYFKNFVFKYEGGPVLEMDNVCTHSNGKYDSKSKIMFTYDSNDYLQKVVEVMNDSIIYQTEMQWETAQYTKGQHVKAIYKYLNGKLFDKLTFNYYQRTRVNKEGITPYLLTPFIPCMDFYMINVALAQYGFWGKPSSELPSSFHWGIGSDADKVKTIYFYEDNSGNLIRIKNADYSNLEEKFTYY